MLNQLAPNLWVADQPLSVLGVHLGTRMTIVRLGSNGLFVHSPIALTPELQAEIDALGPVQAVVAPSAMHHLHIGDFMRAYPDAQYFAAEGVAKKHPELRLHGVLGDRPEFLWGADLDQMPIHGCPRLNEVAFLHRASRTLILTDWVFNFNQGKGLLTRLYLRLTGAWGGPRQSRVHRPFITDRAAALGSTERILAWDFDRVILSHGDIIETGGHNALREATAWLRPAHATASASADRLPA
ncbi:MAG: DUF4336 domain-containing protein [Myxococcales bacterium]|nr:DUF4336 domain-containing protein [Myxococcales bacterium]